MFTINQNLVDDFADKINEKEKKNNKVTSLSSSSTHIQYPSAKAVYDAISEVEANSGGNYIDDYYFDTTTKDIVLDFTSSGSGGGSGGGSSVDIVTSWEQTLSDEKVPSEKLVKDSLDLKSDSTHTHSQYLTEHQSLKTINSQSLIGSGNIDVSPTIDSDWVSNSTNPIQSKVIKSALDNKLDKTHTSYKGKNVVTNASTGTIEFEDKNNHTHSQYLTEHQSLTNYVQKETGKGLFSGSYADLTNKPTYTATVTSSTSGAYKIGSININGSDVDIYGKDTDTHQSLTDYVQKSSTVGLLKNDGSVMVGGTGSSNYAIGNHTHSNYVNPTIADNLTTNDASQVLSAKQGKILNDLIGEAITYINK